MKKTLAVIIMLFSFSSAIPAQNASSNNERSPLIQQLYNFSPLARIVVRNLGMEDKNSNGLIEKGNNEGYEEFVERYGIGNTFEEKEKSIDRGFHANGVVIGANNSKLEENEIVNHYYIHIRFKPAFTTETDTIENEVTAYFYANNLPLVWLDDEQGTVMNAVTAILGEGWNEQEVTVNELETMFRRMIQGLGITGNYGDPAKTGYYTLPEIINLPRNHRSVYCFEVMNLGFWLFSQLRINSMQVDAPLTRSMSHGVNMLYNPQRIIDYFRVSNRYRNVVWNECGPFVIIGHYYAALADKIEGTANDSYIECRERSVIYDKYDITKLCSLAESNYKENRHLENSQIGDFIFEQIDLNAVFSSTRPDVERTKYNLKSLVLFTLVGYRLTNNKPGFEQAEAFLNRRFRNDRLVIQYLEYFRF